MKPYILDNPKTELHIGDCIKIAPKLGKFNLVFSDPPFNINHNYNNFRDSIKVEDYMDFIEKWAETAAIVTNEHGSLWVNVSDEWVCFTQDCCDKYFKLKNWCIWHYRFGQYQKSNFISSKTHVLWYVKDPKKYTFNAEDIMVASDRVAYGDKRTLNTEHPGKRVPLDVWEFPRIQGNNKERCKGHPNQIPERYYERVIKACSNMGDRCLDMFAGSGGFGTVARKLKRESVSIEISSVSAKSAWSRIKKGPVRV